jgi:hypothetical protein
MNTESNTVSKPAEVIAREGRTRPEIMAFVLANHPDAVVVSFAQYTFTLYFSHESVPPTPSVSMEEAQEMARAIKNQYLAPIFRAEEEAELLSTMTRSEQSHYRLGRQMAQRRTTFTAGNIVRSAYGKALVLAYEEGQEKPHLNWTVTLVNVVDYTEANPWKKVGEPYNLTSKPFLTFFVIAQGVQASSLIG